MTTEAKRLVVLSKRKHILFSIVNSLDLTFKIDRQSFPYDNLFERYRSHSRKLKRIQSLIRDIRDQETEIINTILS